MGGSLGLQFQVGPEGDEIRLNRQEALARTDNERPLVGDEGVGLRVSPEVLDEGNLEIRVGEAAKRFIQKPNIVADLVLAPHGPELVVERRPFPVDAVGMVIDRELVFAKVFVCLFTVAADEMTVRLLKPLADVGVVLATEPVHQVLDGDVVDLERLKLGEKLVLAAVDWLGVNKRLKHTRDALELGLENIQTGVGLEFPCDEVGDGLGVDAERLEASLAELGGGVLEQEQLSVDILVEILRTGTAEVLGGLDELVVGGSERDVGSHLFLRSSESPCSAATYFAYRKRPTLWILAL